MISIESSDKPDSNWNKRLLESNTGTIYQTPELASYYETLVNWHPKFLKILNSKGKIVGQILLLIYPRFRKKGKLGKLLEKVPQSKNMICRWTYGPVIFDTEYNNRIRDILVSFLIKQRYLVIGSEHPLMSGFFSGIKSPLKTQKWGTFLIDLSLEQEKLWYNAQKHSARKNVERALKKNVYIKKLNNSNLKSFYHLIKQTKEKVGSDLDFRDTMTLWDKLNSVGFSGFIAYHNEKPVGSLGFSFFNSYINEWGVGRSELDAESKLYTQDLLKWKIIEWGKTHKCKFYDLTGVNPNHTDPKEAGIYRYKKKWGGNFILYNLIKS